METQKFNGSIQFFINGGNDIIAIMIFDNIITDISHPTEEKFPIKVGDSVDIDKDFSSWK